MTLSTGKGFVNQIVIPSLAVKRAEIHGTGRNRPGSHSDMSQLKP